MKTYLTKTIIVNAAVCIFFSWLVPTTSLAQNPPDEQNQQRKSQPITDQQKAQVKSILSKYDASSLTADDAKAINRAFRDSGLRNGPELNVAMKEAGFDPEAIRKLG